MQHEDSTSTLHLSAHMSLHCTVNLRVSRNDTIQVSLKTISTAMFVCVCVRACVQAQRLHEKKEHSTHEKALDQKTRLMLFKMVDGGLLTEVNGCISTGKEACIYHAQGGQYVHLCNTCIYARCV